MNDECGLELSGNGDLVREGRLVGVALASRRSKRLLRLFNFLLEESQRGRQPREAEIAAAIRGDHESGDDPPGSSVRVYVSRLRKMLDQHYAASAGPRLVIPHGEYRIELVAADKLVSDPAEVSEAKSAVASPPRKEVGSQATGKLLLTVIAGFNLVIACSFWITGSHGASALASTKFWQSIASDRHPTIIVVGDHFLFGERHGDEVDQIVRDLAIRNREEFRNFVTADGGHPERFADLDLAYVSSNLVFALRSLWIAIESLSLRQPATSVIAASRLDPDVFKDNNIVYVGPLDGLGRLLNNTLSRASDFALSASDEQLIDKRSGRHFRSDLATNANVAVPHRDYGYIASLPGPSGNRILIISGLGDAGITQMADLASSKADLAELVSLIGVSGDGFEALYQVRAMYTQSYGRKLVVARAISDQGIWDLPAHIEQGASRSTP